MTSSKRQIYSNCLVISPCGKPMFRCSHRKAVWYLDRNLATVISEDPHMTIQLTFEPQGLGGHTFYCKVKENICAVCGSKEELSRHHIVPYCFRRFLPDDYKTHIAFDVLPLCEACHAKYEKSAAKKKEDLVKLYKVDAYYAMQKLSRRIFNYVCLLSGNVNIPASRRVELAEQLKDLMGQLHASGMAASGIVEDQTFEEDEIPWKELSRTQRERLHHKQKGKYETRYSIGKRVMAHIQDYDSFVKDWRQHFLDTMEPKFLPEGWHVNHPTRLSDSLDWAQED